MVEFAPRGKVQGWIFKRIERGDEENTREKYNSHEPSLVLTNMNAVIMVKK